MKVRVAMVDLWQVVLRNAFDAFGKRIVKISERAQSKQKK